MKFDHMSPSFVDRDMFMRFRGGGVGHKSTNEATRCAYEDRDVMDTTNYEPDDSDDEEAASRMTPTRQAMRMKATRQTWVRARARAMEVTIQTWMRTLWMSMRQKVLQVSNDRVHYDVLNSLCLLF